MTLRVWKKRAEFRLRAIPRRLEGFTLRLLGSRLGPPVWKLISLPFRYWVYTFWESNEEAGYSLVRQYWQAGGRTRLALFVILACTALTAISLSGIQVALDAADPGAAAFPLGVGLAALTFGLAYGLSAAVRLPPWGFFIVAAYVSWYSILCGGTLAGKPLFALPALWLLALGWLTLRARAGRMRYGWLAALCLGCAYLTYAAFGLARALPSIPLAVGMGLLGLVLFALLANPIAMPGQPGRPVSTRAVFWGSLPVMALFFTAAVLTDPIQTGRNALLSLRGALGLADLFWLWLGWTLFEGVLDLGEWGSLQVSEILPARLTAWISPLTWAAVGLFCWLAAHPLPLALEVWRKQIGLADWAAGWDDTLYFSVRWQLYAALGALAAWGLLRLTRRLTAERLAQLNGLFAAAFLAFLGFNESFYGFATLESDAVGGLTFWSGLALVGGVAWELAKSGSGYWEGETRERLWTVAAALLGMLGIAAVTLGAGLPDLTFEYTLYSFLGVIYLGVPLSLFKLLPSVAKVELPGGWGLLALFGLGCLSAALVLGLNPYAGWEMGLAPLLWVLVLGLWGRKLARLASPLDGALGGAALALGFVTFWMTPETLPIPYVRFLNDWQARYTLTPPFRPLLQAGQVWLSLAGLATGALLGWAFARFRSRPARLGSALGAALAFGLLVPVLPGVPTAAPVAPAPTSEPAASPQPTMVAAWEQAALGETGYLLSIPPGWVENPRKVEGLLLNRFSPDGGALLSARLYEGLSDPLQVAQWDIEGWAYVRADNRTTVEPVERRVGNWPAVWMENESLEKQSLAMDVYLVVPEGVWNLRLLCLPQGAQGYRGVLEAAAASLRKTAP